MKYLFIDLPFCCEVVLFCANIMCFFGVYRQLKVIELLESEHYVLACRV